MKLNKLNKTEQNALAFCDALMRNGGGTVVIEWKRSAQWGSNPQIEYMGGRCCSVSGCGYDKESTALSEVLRFLAPRESEAYGKIWSCGGAGVSSVQRELSAIGWDLVQTANTKTVNVYNLTRK